MKIKKFFVAANLLNLFFSSGTIIYQILLTHAFNLPKKPNRSLIFNTFTFNTQGILTSWFPGKANLNMQMSFICRKFRLIPAKAKTSFLINHNPKTQIRGWNPVERVPLRPQKDGWRLQGGRGKPMMRDLAGFFFPGCCRCPRRICARVVALEACSYTDIWEPTTIYANRISLIF